MRGLKRVHPTFRTPLPGYVKLLTAVLLLPIFCGCATHRPLRESSARPFNFQTDTFAFPNQLLWEYDYDCVVLARSARQFFENARFDVGLPVADETTYRKLIRQVVNTNPRDRLPPGQRIVIPGYTNLRAFSEAREPLLKAECGSAWQSYDQRGNWRMIMPFSRQQQEGVAGQLAADLARSGPVLVHLVRFPHISINHTMLLYACRVTEGGTEFTAYDPNTPAHPVTLSYDHASRTFLLPRTHYFPGGRVDVYEIYHRWDY